MGGGVWGAIAGGVLGFISSREQQSQGRDWNRYANQAANMMGPQTVMNSAYQYNPYLWSALGQQWGASSDPFGNKTQGSSAYANNPYANSLRQLINNPGYVDPAVMNNNLLQVDRGAAQNLQRVQGMMGRSGLQGGLGGAFALSNQASTTNQKAGLMQQYVLFREQQRRSDINMINEMMQQSIGTASQNNLSKANFLIQQKPVLGWRGVVGATAAGAAQGYGLGSQTKMPGMGQSYGGSQVGGGSGSGGGYGTPSYANTTSGYNPGNDITPSSSPTGQFTDAGSTSGTGMTTSALTRPISSPTSAPTVYSGGGASMGSGMSGGRF